MLRINGFSLFEVLIATAILFTMITTITPVTVQLLKEETILSERRLIVHELHDELQPFLFEHVMLPNKINKNIAGRDITFKFTNENKYVKGCVTWKNARNNKETYCLYGLSAA